MKTNKFISIILLIAACLMFNNKLGIAQTGNEAKDSIEVYTVFPSLNEIRDAQFKNILQGLPQLKIGAKPLQDTVYNVIKGYYFPYDLAQKYICKNFDKIYKYDRAYNSCRRFVDFSPVRYEICGLLPTNGKFIMVLFRAKPSYAKKGQAMYLVLTFTLQGQFLSGFSCCGYLKFGKNKANLSELYLNDATINTNYPALKITAIHQVRKIYCYANYEEKLYINDKGEIKLLYKKLTKKDIYRN
jgi:hypothetical protein